MLYKIYFWMVFYMYYKLICILYALLCGQNFIHAKSGCYRPKGRVGSAERLGPSGEGEASGLAGLKAEWAGKGSWVESEK
jgi:hypothetical protein